MRIDDVVKCLLEIREKEGNMVVCVFDGVLIGYTTVLSFEKVEDDCWLDEEEKVQKGDFIIL